MKLLLVTLLTMFTAVILPKPELLVIMGIAIIVDFITGVAKSFFQGKARTSTGFRKTIQKFLQYAGAIVVALLLSNLTMWDGTATPISNIFEYFTNVLVAFIIYIELTSILENLYVCDPNSVISRKVFKFMLNLLTFQIKNNPATKLENTEKKD